MRFGLRAGLPLILLASPLACAKQVAGPERLPSPHHGHRAATSTTASLGMFPAEWGLPSRLVDTKRRVAVSLDEALTDLAQVRVVYVSESHENPHHHAVQGAIVTQLWRRDRALSIGMEMFQAPFQTSLDDYLSGRLDEEALLEQSEYQERWGYDFTYYRSVMEFAKAHRIPVVALNARSELTKKVARDGLGALSADEQKEVPELDLGSRSHREMVREAFEGHEIEDHKFEQFYAAQVIWDETMAAHVAEAATQLNSPRMVVLAGTGHVRHSLGIPRRAARRGAKPYRTVVPVMLGEGQPSLAEQLEDPAGDYLWVMSVDESKLPAVGVPLEGPEGEEHPASLTQLTPGR